MWGAALRSQKKLWFRDLCRLLDLTSPSCGGLERGCAAHRLPATCSKQSSGCCVAATRSKMVAPGGRALSRLRRWGQEAWVAHGLAGGSHSCAGGNREPELSVGSQQAKEGSGEVAAVARLSLRRVAVLGSPVACADGGGLCGHPHSSSCCLPFRTCRGALCGFQNGGVGHWSSLTARAVTGEPRG